MANVVELSFIGNDTSTDFFKTYFL